MTAGVEREETLRGLVESLYDFCGVEEHHVESRIYCMAEVVVAHIR